MLLDYRDRSLTTRLYLEYNVIQDTSHGDLTNKRNNFGSGRHFSVFSVTVFRITNFLHLARLFWPKTKHTPTHIVTVIKGILLLFYK